MIGHSFKPVDVPATADLLIRKIDGDITSVGSIAHTLLGLVVVF